MTTDALLPRLRPLDIKRVRHGNDEFFLLRDPLELHPEQLLVPLMLGPMLLLLDGTRTLERLRLELMLRYGLPLDTDHLADLVDTLSRACLLDDDIYTSAMSRMRDDYRAAPCRPPALIDRVYPADPRRLTALLRHFEQQAGAEEGPADGVVGLVSPHIDYNRGAPIYARLWRQAAPALREADVAVIFGTDHNGSPGTLTLTRQSYATPWGTLPADLDAVDAMAATLGPDAAFAEELHHRAEHSVELAAVWLHHVRDGVPCTMIPVLCGHPLSFMVEAAGTRMPVPAEAGSAVGEDGGLAWNGALRALAALRAATAGKKVIAIAAADLAHVGPAFGDPEPFSRLAKQRVRLADEEILAACNEGPGAVLRCVGRIEDRYRICGLSPVALTLAFTGPVTAEPTGYDQCPADHDGGDGSIVSIAGVMLREKRET